jgi:hypothetical protein
MLDRLFGLHSTAFTEHPLLIKPEVDNMIDRVVNSGDIVHPVAVSACNFASGDEWQESGPLSPAKEDMSSELASGDEPTTCSSSSSIKNFASSRTDRVLDIESLIFPTTG